MKSVVTLPASKSAYGNGHVLQLFDNSPRYSALVQIYGRGQHPRNNSSCYRDANSEDISFILLQHVGFIRPRLLCTEFYAEMRDYVSILFFFRTNGLNGSSLGHG